MSPNRCGNDASGSDPRADVSHEVTIDQRIDGCADIDHGYFRSK